VVVLLPGAFLQRGEKRKEGKKYNIRKSNKIKAQGKR